MIDLRPVGYVLGLLVAALGVTIGVGVLLSLLFAPLSLVLFAGDPPRT